MVVTQVVGNNPKPAQRFGKEAFLQWAAKLKSQGRQVHAVYEACGFGFGLQRKLSALGIQRRFRLGARPKFLFQKVIALIKWSGQLPRQIGV